MIWFDFDNSPHIQIFRPILKNLNNKKKEYLITARDFAQTTGLLKLYDIPYIEIGRYGGKNKIAKIFNLYSRSTELKNKLKSRKLRLAVSHGSRTQVIASGRMGIDSIVLLDYEYTENKIFNRFAKQILMPKVIPDARLKSSGFDLKKIVRYNGLKEEIYLNGFIPDLTFRQKLNVYNNEILVLIRPPGMTSNYHDERSEDILLYFIKKLLTVNNLKIIVASRTKVDRDFIEKKFSKNSNLRFLEKPVDGLQLIYNSNITISGGGTMNRESALLGTKTYSIFSGRKPFVDEYLESKGLITFVHSKKQVDDLIIEKSVKTSDFKISNNVADEITNFIINYN